MLLQLLRLRRITELASSDVILLPIRCDQLLACCHTAPIGSANLQLQERGTRPTSWVHNPLAIWPPAYVLVMLYVAASAGQGDVKVATFHTFFVAAVPGVKQVHRWVKKRNLLKNDWGLVVLFLEAIGQNWFCKPLTI